jgi:glycosyltransferase involved in cell wall biosynthesis
MRILNVNSLIDLVLGGGTAERTLQISKALYVAGHDVTVLGLNIGLPDRPSMLPSGVQLILLRCVNDRFHIPLVSWSWLRKMVGTFDVVHMMGHWSLLNALVARAARLEGIPYVVCPAGALPVFGRSSVLKRIYNFLLGRRLVRYASAWIAVTEDERLHFVDYVVAPEDVTVIPNGISPEDYSDQQDDMNTVAGLASNVPYILFMGRLNPIKGPDLLLDAFVQIAKRWPDLQLVFSGPDGGMLEVLRERAALSNVDGRVHFPGFIGGSNKISVYRNAKFLVIPSRSEAMSIVVLEAGACRIPVILTDQCGFNGVQSVGGGLVVSPDSGSIELALDRLLSAEAGELSRMGADLHDFVMTSFTWSAMVLKYTNLYDGIVRADDDST